MQQGDPGVRAVDKERIAMLEIADHGAVAGDLTARPDPLRHAQLHRAAGTDHDRPVAQGVRADGRQDPDVEVRLDDRPATGHRIGGGPGRRRDHDAVAAVRVDETSIDRRFEVHRAAGLAFVHHHIIQGQSANRGGIAVLQPCSQQRPPVLRVPPGQHRVDIFEH